MIKKIIFATGNAGKLKEIREILEGSGIEVVTMKEAGYDLDIVEDGKTFDENALIKARTVAKASGEAAMSDDSGLSIDYLNGEPGIYSARFMGHDTSYDIKNAKLLEMLKDAKGDARSARYECSVALVLPDGREFVKHETMEGLIANAPAGQNGFGYDPIFMLPQYGKTAAEISPEEKNKISHRGKALRAMKEVIYKLNEEEK
ncbi:MAG: XTP/dITP diphosphatase [Catonella sp.]|nr:XTP/dITP diphosphatase [Catonella sp.]